MTARVADELAMLLPYVRRMMETLRRIGRSAARVFAAETPQERERRDADAFALLLVCLLAAAKYVTGLTDPRAPFTLYALAVAVTAARAGLEPAIVATLGSVLLGGLAAPLPAQAAARVVFGVEALSIALLVTALRSRVQAGEAARRGAEATIDDLRRRGYEQAADHVARRREWDEHREADARAQAALQEAADATRRQLASLESLTDPEVNPMEGPAAVSELLERLRIATRADGAALVAPAGVLSGLVAARGLKAAVRPMRAESVRLSPGRVALVHNDPARVEQLSAVNWSGRVASLLVVPVMHDGRVRSAIEVVSERPRQVDDWDVALARIVADRLASFVVGDRGMAA
jgi:hypothetical protein